ncbi:MAG TPA: hypothetical protein VF660_12180 [Actinomycetota bacterium]
MSGIEARARVEAEGKLLKRHRAEYQRVAGRKGHVDAVRALVKAHKTEYDKIISQTLIRKRAEATQAASAA